MEGRDVLWREVAGILRTNPLLRTTLVVPADEQQKDYNRVHPNPVVVATIEEDDAMLLHFLQAILQNLCGDLKDHHFLSRKVMKVLLFFYNPLHLMKIKEVTQLYLRI